MTNRRVWIPAIVLVALIILVSPGCGRCAPVGLAESMDNLQGTWLFRTDPYEVGEKEGWQRPGYNDSGWRTLSVPGAWEYQGITDPRPGQKPQPKNGLPATDYDGVAWYRLRFTAPKSWAGQNLVLFFGGIDDEDRTFVNGKLVGTTGAGQMLASTLIRRYRVPADLVVQGKENVLAVRVLDHGGPGGIEGTPCFLVPEKMLTTEPKLPGADRPLAERFVDPPAESRILKIIHSWPNSAADQGILIRTLVDQGFGGVVSNVSFTDYLTSEDRWKDYARALTEAKKAGMSLWVYDEKGYPSGTAGGLTMKGHPEWEVQGLLANDTSTDGGRVSLDVPSGKLILARAYPETEGRIDADMPTDLSDRIQGGKLSWQAPVGRWRVMVVTQDRLYDNTLNAMSLGDKLPYINLLMPEPTARFLELTHGAYAKHLGDDLGKWLVSTFTDEPSLMSRFTAGSKFRGLPWAPNLPVEFRKRRGYDLEPVVPLLLAESGPKGEKARYDFWLTVGELVSENYFGQIQDYCHKHNLRSGGHLVQEEPILDNVAFYGDLFRCVRRQDAPSIDCLTSEPAQVPWQIARVVSSVAELTGKTVTMCETSDFGQVYRAAGDTRPTTTVSEDQIRGTCNRLMFGGINTITSYYTFKDMPREKLRRLNDWVGRCCTMLAGGHRVADIAMLYPVQSIWPKFIPARVGPTDEPSADKISQTYDTVMSELYGAARDFSYIDTLALTESKPEKGSLVHGDLRWRVLVLPAVDTLPAEAWERVAEFWRSGGVVIAVGALPRNSESEFPSAHVQSLAAEIFGRSTDSRVSVNPSGGVAIYLAQGSEGMLPAVLDSVLGRDVKLPGAHTPIHATHRRIDGHEVYFVINDGASPWEGSIDLAASGKGEQWDPATGRVTPVASPSGIRLKLVPYGGTILRFTAASEPKRLTPKNGSVAGPELHPVPLVEPSLGSGEFVKATLTKPDTQPNTWRDSATLTKSKVDTFSMLAFTYPKALDLTNAEYIRIEAGVPEGQSASTKLLLFLRDRQGGEYFTDTGISLSAPGPHEVTIPIGRLQPTPWSNKPNAKLDFSSVTNMVIGWGGYLGTEGERVEFTLALPQIGGAR